jgi:hypothetical protein
MTQRHAQHKIGPIRPLDAQNARWQECRVPSRTYPDSAPMFAGQFWTSGYFLPGEDPASDALPWADIAQDIDLSRALAERLTTILVHSDTDSPYFPCFFRLRENADFAAAFKAALGWQVAPEFEQSPFWGDLQIRPLPPKDAPGGNAFFWDPLEDAVVDEYFSVAALTALRAVTERMRAALTDLRHVTFPDSYITYPVFWLGRTAHGSWVGLWALRVDT